MSIGKPRIKLPEKAAIGEIIEIKALVSHPMETGNRKDAQGRPIARNIVHTFRATFAGEPVFSAEFGSGVSSNPYIGFQMRVPGPGAFEMTWIDDRGSTVTERAILSVG